MKIINQEIMKKTLEIVSEMDELIKQIKETQPSIMAQLYGKKMGVRSTQIVAVIYFLLKQKILSTPLSTDVNNYDH